MYSALLCNVFYQKCISELVEREMRAKDFKLPESLSVNTFITWCEYRVKPVKHICEDWVSVAFTHEDLKKHEEGR